MSSLAEVLAAFTDATGLNALNLAGTIVLLAAAMGGLLAMAWVLRSGSEAVRGGVFHAPRTVLLSVAAFLFLLIVLGVLYD